MPFLRTRDYLPYIQPGTLNQLLQATATQGNTSSLEVRISAEDDAIEEISEYLRQKYDICHAFEDLLTYNYTDTYYGNSRVELYAPAWVAQSVYTVNTQVWYTDNKVYLNIQATDALWTATSYTVGQKVLYTDGNYYVCILDATSTDLPTNVTYWTEIPSENPGNTDYWTVLGWYQQLFYLKYPYCLFEINHLYNVGDNVFWKGYNYTCLKQSAILNDTARIQYNYTTEYPWPNAFPGVGNDNYSVAQWGVGTPYSVTGISMVTTASAYNPGSSYTVGQLTTIGTQLYQCIADNSPAAPVTPGTDIITWQPISWIAGDNRNKSLVTAIIHTALHVLHNNIAPQNIPLLREKNYIKSLKWAESIKEGVLVVDLLSMPVLQPLQGGRILIGGRPKSGNWW